MTRQHLRDVFCAAMFLLMSSLIGVLTGALVGRFLKTLFDSLQ